MEAEALIQDNTTEGALPGVLHTYIQEIRLGVQAISQIQMQRLQNIIMTMAEGKNHAHLNQAQTLGP